VLVTHRMLSDRSQPGQGSVGGGRPGRWRSSGTPAAGDLGLLAPSGGRRAPRCPLSAGHGRGGSTLRDQGAKFLVERSGPLVGWPKFCDPLTWRATVRSSGANSPAARAASAQPLDRRDLECLVSTSGGPNGQSCVRLMACSTPYGRQVALIQVLSGGQGRLMLVGWSASQVRW
jgi:hypothetical protein